MHILKKMFFFKLTLKMFYKKVNTFNMFVRPFWCVILNVPSVAFGHS